jgi:signal transduction histidine kinase
MLVYLGAVSGLGSLFRGLPDQTAFFLATGLVAILFEPFRQRLQRGVNRLMYGERDDPYAVLTRLSSALESAPNPEDVLAALTAQIGQTLKIPYVAIYLQQEDEEKLGAAYGVSQEDLLSLPLVYQEERIGSLQAARRAPGESFSGPDLRLLESIARQAGPAVQSVKLHRQLMHSRAQIVSEREEERRRIRRDLHDELGPILASQSLKLVAASRMVEAAPEQAKAMLDELAQQSQQTVVEIRRLVHGLRPPALDQLGLIEAIRDFGRSSGEPNGHSMVVEISQPAEGLPELPAAVGVHAYRIVLEALANATRHGHARLCTVKFYLEPGAAPGAHPAVLGIQICDDGRGLPEHYRAGVGLRSMRERAEEIGGTFKIEPARPRGTTVTVRLPLSP